LFNDATQVVLMREGSRTVLSMQNNYKGPAEDFAMVVPVPVVLQEENVKTLQSKIFEKVDRLTSPRLVEYWEQDPCPKISDRRAYRKRSSSAQMDKSTEMGAANEGAPPPVRVEAEFSVGEYDILVLSADEASALDDWLRENRYQIPDGAAPYLQPYIDAGMYFFVAKVDIEKVRFQAETAVLSPLRFDYDSPEFSLPVRLGMINSAGSQDLIVYLLGRGKRYEAANYPNVTIPTNIEVADRVRDGFGSFYSTLFAKTMDKNPRAVVTEYSWNANTCDPCPGPTLTHADYQILGADAMGESVRRGRRSAGGGWVITRLHTRYAKGKIGQDIVFREAAGIAGGREHILSGGRLEEGARKSRVNNFQGRYIIRHNWKGPVQCANPVFGRWGAPVARVAPSTNTTKRRPTVFKRLSPYVRQDIPELSVRAGVGKTCRARNQSGVCEPTNRCDGESVPGYCPGGTSIQCCLP
jgi:hypothetical protein